MILQLEDCMDYLEVLCGDGYEFVFLFDHTSGHAKKRVNGLYAFKTNKTFSGYERLS